MCFTESSWIERIAYLQVTLDMRTHIYIVIMHNMMCRILIIGEYSSNLGGMKFESLKVYSNLSPLMLLVLNYLALYVCTKKKLIESKAYSF